MARCSRHTAVCSLLIFLLFFSEQLSAQGCCSAGASSLSGFESGVLSHRTLALSLNYQFNSLTQAYQGTNRVEDPLMRTAEVAYVTMQAEYGLVPSVSLLASLYFSDKSREITVVSGQGIGQFPETAKFRASGLGDLTLLAKYQITGATVTSPFGLSFGGGASLPTGSSTEEQEGSQLSIDLQPGTGAIALIAWGYTEYSLVESGVTFFAGGIYRYSGMNFDQYRIGDEIITNIGSQKGLGEFFSVALVIRSRYAMKDFAENRFLIGTGGTYHDLMPAVSYAEGRSAARIFGQIPLYRNVRGLQLTSTYLLGAEYQYTFDFTTER